MYRKIVPASIRKKLGDWAKHQPDKRGLNFLKRNATSVEDSYIGQAFIMDNEEADEVLAPAYKSKMRYQDVTKPYFDQVKDQDDLHKKLFLDMHLWLPHDILLKADKMTMAHSLELRVPYLDKKVWELARSIDSKYCVDGMETKKAFRTSALSHIPMDWAKRKKLGFLVPFRVWLREDKYYNKVKEMFQRDFVSEFFNQELLLKWLEDHKNKVGNYEPPGSRAVVHCSSPKSFDQQTFLSKTHQSPRGTAPAPSPPPAPISPDWLLIYRYDDDVLVLTLT